MYTHTVKCWRWVFYDLLPANSQAYTAIYEAEYWSGKSYLLLGVGGYDLLVLTTYQLNQSSIRNGLYIK